MQAGGPVGQIAVQDLWQTTLFLSDWPEQGARAARLCEHIRGEAKAYRENIASGVARAAKSAQGLVESPLNLFNATQNADMQALAGWISRTVRAVVHKVNGAQGPIDRLQVEYTNSWFHITNDGGFHDAHTHGNCSWCGIFYVEAGESAQAGPDAASAGNGLNRFYSPIPFGGQVFDYGNNYLRSRHYLDVQPVSGRLVIFPSYLLHSALPYRGATDRIVIAFNTRTNLAPGQGVPQAASQ